MDRLWISVDGIPRNAPASGPYLLTTLAVRWVAPIPRAADGTRNTASTSADIPTIDFGLKRTALTAPSRMSPNCNGRSGTMPGLCAVSIGICRMALCDCSGRPPGGGPAYDGPRAGSPPSGPGAEDPPVAVMCLPGRSGIAP